MNEIKYGNMPASVIEEIRLASKNKYPNTFGNGMGFSYFMEDFLPILAARWPDDKGIEKLQSAKDKEIRDLRARESQSNAIFKTLRQVLLCREGESLVDVARARMSELAQKPTAENASCNPDLMKQLTACVRAQRIRANAKKDDDLRVFIVEARKALGFSVEIAAMKLAPKGVPLQLAEYILRWMEENNWDKLKPDFYNELLRIEICLKYLNLIDAKVDELLAQQT